MRTERAAFLTLAALAAGPAGAETSPYYIGTSVSASHDSNVFRSADAPASDTTVSAGVVGGFDQPIGRQRVYTSGSINANRHVHLGQLDDTSYTLTTGIDWATIQQLSGTLRYSTQHGLAAYGVANAPATTEKNILRTQQFSASASYPLLSEISFDTSFENRSVAYSAEAYRSLASEQDVIGASLRYLPGPSLGVAVGGRSTRGDTPNFAVAPGVFEPDRLHRSDIDLSATLSGARSSLTARVSFSHESHSQPAYPGFSGLTGAVDADYAPTAKLRVAAAASRDTGSATTFLRFGTTGGINVDANQISTQLRASINYAATPKISTAAQVRYNRGEVSNLLGTSQDRVQSYALQADWEPQRSLRFSCSVSREIRSSTTLGLDSRATVSGCTTIFTVR